MGSMNEWDEVFFFQIIWPNLIYSNLLELSKKVLVIFYNDNIKFYRIPINSISTNSITSNTEKLIQIRNGILRKFIDPKTNFYRTPNDPSDLTWKIFYNINVSALSKFQNRKPHSNRFPFAAQTHRIPATFERSTGDLWPWSCYFFDARRFFVSL